MREGREKGTDDENRVPQNHKKKKTPKHLEKVPFSHLKFQQYYVFQKKNLVNCETPFPFFFFCNFLSKNVPFRIHLRLFSGLIEKHLAGGGREGEED